MKSSRKCVFVCIVVGTILGLLILGTSLSYFFKEKDDNEYTAIVNSTAEEHDALETKALRQDTDDGGCTTDPAFNIDFSNTVVTENTLHEAGELRLSNVGLFGGRELDLVLTNAPGSSYFSTMPENNGVFGNFAEVQIVNNQAEDPRLDGIGDFTFCFRDSVSDEPVRIESFHMSFFDFDERNDKGFEKLTIDQNDPVAFQRFEPSEVIPLCENLEPLQMDPPRCPDGDNICYFSSTSGGPADNPNDPNMLTPEQLARTLMFTFRETDCFTLEYSQLCNDEVCVTGGNMIFAGTANQIALGGTCEITREPVSPTNSPVSPPPRTMSPSSEATRSPDISVTPSPNVGEPTNMPTRTREPSSVSTPSPDTGITPSPTASGPGTRSPNANEPTTMPSPTRGPSSESTPSPDSSITPSPNAGPDPTRDPSPESTPSPNMAGPTTSSPDISGPTMAPVATREPSSEFTPSPNAISTPSPNMSTTPSPNVSGPTIAPSKTRDPSSEETRSPNAISTPSPNMGEPVTLSPNINGPTIAPNPTRDPSSESTPNPNVISTPSPNVGEPATPSPNVNGPTIAPDPTRDPSSESTPNPNTISTPSPSIGEPTTPSPNDNEPTVLRPTRDPSSESTPSPNAGLTPSPEIDIPLPTIIPTRRPNTFSTKRPTHRPNAFSTKRPTHRPNQFSTKRPEGTTTMRINDLPGTVTDPLLSREGFTFENQDAEESDASERTGMLTSSAGKRKKSKESKKYSSLRPRSGKGGKKSKMRRRLPELHLVVNR